MSTERTFTLAGMSTLNGVRTFRYANGDSRRRHSMLATCGHKDIEFYELPKPMTKVQATAYLIKHVPGAAAAVVPTRAKDKTAATPVLVEAQKKVAAAQKRAATVANKKRAA